MEPRDILIVANGSSLRAFQYESREERLDEPIRHLVELTLTEEEGHPESGLQEDTDRQGRFGTKQRAGIRGNLVSGERHSLKKEQEKRAAVAIAASVEHILNRADAESWVFVVPSQWKGEIVSHLGEQIAARMTLSIVGDWIKFPIAKIESLLK
tara:strand:- start:895 stop:1356 length:462 start_codon:yes stop_codon:yes gene_type:complete